MRNGVIGGLVGVMLGGLVFVACGGAGQQILQGFTPSEEARVAALEAQLAALTFADIGGSATDAQIPDTITVDLATHALTAGAVVRTATLAFEQDYLNLVSGEVEQAGPGGPTLPWHVSIPYNSNGTLHGRLWQNQSLSMEVARLNGQPFDTVTAAAISGASWSTALDDNPIGSNDTMLVRLPDGSVYKVGNWTESPADVTFNYVLLSSGP